MKTILIFLIVAAGHSVFGASETIPVLACFFDTTDVFPSTRVNPVTLKQSKNTHAIRALFLASDKTSTLPDTYEVQLAASMIDGCDSGCFGDGPFKGLPVDYVSPLTASFSGAKLPEGNYTYIEKPGYHFRINLQKDLSSAELSDKSIFTKQSAGIKGKCAPCLSNQEEYCQPDSQFPRIVYP